MRRKIMVLIGVTLIMLVMAMGLGGCKEKPKIKMPDPQEADDIHEEAEETLYGQEYLEVGHLQKAAKAAIGVMEAENVYDFTFLLTDVELWDPDSTHFALIEQAIPAWYHDNRSQRIRERALTDELCVAIATHPDLPKIYDALRPEEMLQVHGVIMQWRPSISVNEGANTEDEASYWLIDESGDGSWNWVAYSEDDSGEVKFKGADGQCEFKNVQTIELRENQIDNKTVWDIEAMFCE